MRNLKNTIRCEHYTSDPFFNLINNMRNQLSFTFPIFKHSEKITLKKAAQSWYPSWYICGVGYVLVFIRRSKADKYSIVCTGMDDYAMYKYQLSKDQAEEIFERIMEKEYIWSSDLIKMGFTPD